MPSDDLDRELRAALFAHIDRLRRVAGGLITADQLNARMPFRGEQVPIWNQQKGIFKPRILGGDGAALTIQTSFESPYDDGDDPDSGRFTYRYRGTDPEQADNRALRQAFLRASPLLYLVAVRQGLYDALYPFYVVVDRRDKLLFELVADVPGSADEVVGRVLRVAEPAKAYATRMIRQRLHQQRFRYLVLDAYREQCAVCRLRHVDLLDAAHILPDRDVRGRPEIPNGLSLCKIHHSAYDVGILGVDPDYQIHLRRDILDEVDGPMLRHGLQEVHGTKLILPRSVEKRPNREYLAERFERFRAA